MIHKPTCVASLLRIFTLTIHSSYVFVFETWPKTQKEKKPSSHCQTEPNKSRYLPLSLSFPASWQTSVMSPGDVVKVRLQCQTESKRRGVKVPKYHGPIHCLLSIVRDEGFRGLYRGALPLMLRDGPSYATYFLTYTTIYEWLSGGSMKKLGEYKILALHGRNLQGGGGGIWHKITWSIQCNSPHNKIT